MPSEQGFNPGLSSPGQQPGQGNLIDASAGPPNLSKPPTMAQRSTAPHLQGQQHLSNVPLQGQQNVSTSTLSGQQNTSGPFMSGQSNLLGPPLPGQQGHNTIAQGMLGQQILAGPPLSKQNLSGPPLPGQPNLSGPSLSRPPLPGQQYPPLQGQQKPGSYPEPSNMTMSNLHGPSNLPGPPLMSQQNIPPPPMSGQQSGGASSPLTSQQSFNKPPLLGQQNLSGPPVQLPLPGQPMRDVMHPTTNLSQQSQRQYTTGPPLPGQNMGSPLGLNRNPPGAMPNYQQPGYQGYNNVCL